MRFSCGASSRCAALTRCRATARILDGISAERTRLREIREASDIIVDTSDLNIHQLATNITETFAAEDTAGVQVTVHELRLQVRPAAGCRHGRRRALPPQSVLDTRNCARSPGSTRRCATTCSGRGAPMEFIEAYVAALRPVLAGYQRENKRHATIAVGCTGGKHRSVAIAEELATHCTNSRGSR